MTEKSLEETLLEITEKALASNTPIVLRGEVVIKQMTCDDIIRLAKEAGFGTLADLWPHALERFAALVAAAEREACAKLAEPSEEHRRDASWGYVGGEGGVELLDSVAAAIRARGEA